jgi:hypothetical protein
LTKTQFEAFRGLRQKWRELCERAAETPGLWEAQRALALKLHNGDYEVVRPAVDNGALDDVTQAAAPKIILVGDNPGRREQAAERYLVGPSGKIAVGFFRAHPEQDIDFRRDVVILNNTPIHTCRTAELKQLAETGGDAVRTALSQTQTETAELLAEFQAAIKVPIWVTGYSEVKKNGIFAVWGRRLAEVFPNQNSLYFYRHFSMNQFTIELSQEQKQAPDKPLAETIKRIGIAHRERVLSLFTRR